MQLHATKPFFAAPDMQPVVRMVCTALGIVRFAREPQVLAYAGPMGLTRDALEALINSGILRRGLFHPAPTAARTEPFLALGTQGARMLSEVTGLAVKGVGPAVMKRGSQKRAHDVDVGDFCLGVLALSREDQVKVLGLEADPKKVPVCLTAIKSKRGPERIALQPDVYVLSDGPHGPVALMVEIDRGTIGLPRMADKYASYLAWKEAGGPEKDLAVRGVRVLTVAPTDRRILALHTAALTANDGRRSGFLLFATRDMLAQPGALLAPCARPLGNQPDQMVPVFAGPGDSELPHAA
jgi:hypothetical protein